MSALHPKEMDGSSRAGPEDAPPSKAAPKTPVLPKDKSSHHRRADDPMVIAIDAAEAAAVDLVHQNRTFWREYLMQMKASMKDVHSKALLTYVGIGGALVGAMAAGFAAASEETEDYFETHINEYPDLIWLTLPVGLPAILMLTRMFFDGTAGSGIPLEMGSLFLVNGDPNFIRIFSVNIMIGKFGLTLLAQLCGASAGREGPTVQVASCIFVLMLQLATKYNLPFINPALTRPTRGARAYDYHLQDVIVTGGASGIAGAFSTPLGGIIFAIEEMGSRYTKSLGHAMIIAVAISGAVAIAIRGFHPIFEGYEDEMPGIEFFLVVPFVSVPAGILGGLWSLILVYGVRIKKAALFSTLPAPYILACLCGVGAAMCGYWADGETYGSGINMARKILEGTNADDEASPGYAFATLKMIATWLTYWAGTPGGVFAPTIAVGAGWGRCFYAICRHFSEGIEGHEPTVALITTTAYFAGVTQSPITAAAILLGMLECTNLVKPAMFAASLIGWACSKIVSPKVRPLRSLSIR